MLEVLGWTVLAIVVAGGLCALAVIVLPAGEQIAPALRDEPVWALPPDRELTPEDVDTVRLPVAIRGYRFAETDLLLDRLAEEIKTRDVEIARLRGYATPAEADRPVADVQDADVPDADVRDPRDQGAVADEPADRPADHAPYAPPADTGDGPPRDDHA